jgi:hypothetical protein
VKAVAAQQMASGMALKKRRFFIIVMSAPERRYLRTKCTLLSHVRFIAINVSFYIEKQPNSH